MKVLPGDCEKSSQYQETSTRALLPSFAHKSSHSDEQATPRKGTVLNLFMRNLIIFNTFLKNIFSRKHLTQCEDCQDNVQDVCCTVQRFYKPEDYL